MIYDSKPGAVAGRVSPDYLKIPSVCALLTAVTQLPPNTGSKDFLTPTFNQT